MSESCNLGHNHAEKMPIYDSTDFVVREDILAKAKELAALLSTSEEVQMFQQAEKNIQDHARIQELISLIKKKQKEIVGFEYFKNADMVKKIEEEIEALHAELDGFPIVQQFQQSQTDINYLLQLVVDVLKDTLSEKIQVESGTTAPPTKCD
jgi:cell fate (sporulation/competence/biofilm development) regulator YmcA (YheA/YmcA/DUF963 family)